MKIQICTKIEFNKLPFINHADSIITRILLTSFTYPPLFSLLMYFKANPTHVILPLHILVFISDTDILLT